MTAQSTYVMVGNREDLTDMIWMVSPSDTPLLSAIKKVKASNTKHEWQTDSLAAPSASNATVEGADMGTPADDPTVRVDNYTQILTKDAKVTGTQESGMVHAGMKRAMADQIAKKMKEIKTDWEMSAFGAKNAKAAGNASTAREMADIITYLKTNTSRGSGGADPTGDGSDIPTDGTQRVFTEAMLTAVLQSCFDEGGDPTLIALGSFNKGKLSGFTGGQTRYADTSNKQLVSSIDVYIGDFHTLKAVPSRHVRARDALVIDPGYLAVADLRGLHSINIAQTGDSIKKQLVWETTLEVCNEAAHGTVADLTTS